LQGSETGISKKYTLSKLLASSGDDHNLLELAKQGNVKAIAALMSTLQPKGITVSKHLKDKLP